MLVSHKEEIHYTKTLKTAGTSVEVYFEPYCMPEGEWSFGHARAEYVSQAGIIGLSHRQHPDYPGGYLVEPHARRRHQEAARRRHLEFVLLNSAPCEILSINLVSAFYYFNPTPAAQGIRDRILKNGSWPATCR